MKKRKESEDPTNWKNYDDCREGGAERKESVPEGGIESLAWDIRLRCRGDVHVEMWSGKYGVQEKNKISYRVMTLGNFIEGVRVNEERQGPRT